MTPIEWHEFVKTVCSYYERKMPSDHALDLWQDRVNNIPHEPLDWIRRKIFESCETFPKNLPSVIWDLYNAWLDAHPDKRAPKESINCPDCEGGWLVLERDQDPYKIPISYTAACGRCRQIKMAHYMRLEEAMLKGYRRKNLITEHTVRRTTVRDMVNSVGRHMADPTVLV